MINFNHFSSLKPWIAVLLCSIWFSAATAQIDITCPAETNLGTYDCTTIGDVPLAPSSLEDAAAAPYSLTVNNPTASTFVDAIDSDIIFYCQDNARSMTRTIRIYEDTDFSFTYTDGEPYAECTYTIGTAADTTPPTFVPPSLADLPCDVDIDDLSVTGRVVSIDDENCPVNSASEFVNYSDAINENMPCPGSSVVTRSWVAVDPCGNASEPQTQRINLIDDIGPSFTVPTDVTLDCGADATDLTLTGDVTDESDNCDGVTTIAASHRDVETITEFDGCDELTIITRVWGAADGCGNVTTQSQTIIIRCENSNPVVGCMDPTASNYDANANCNDVDLCVFVFAVGGCTDPCAANFDPDATEDDGSCETYSTECNTDCTAGDLQIWDATTCSCITDGLVISGCTDASACNFNPDANCDDGSCSTIPVCNTDPCVGNIEELSADGCTCQVVQPQILGCMDPAACNYNELANCENNSCVPFPVCNDDPCSGDITDLIGSDPCACRVVELQILGCNDETAQNYNPDANCDDGSCIYGPNCSFTQGFWGNPGGKKDGRTTTEMIDAALESNGGSIIVGADGQSITVSSAKCVLSLLPSTSGPRALKAGDELYEGNCSQNKKNRIRNRLAAEALVLSLNTLNSPGLNTVVLCDPANCLVDRVPDTVCDALGESGTITDLLVLANEALGGVYEVTNRNFYSDLDEAINVISERYNDCKNPCSAEKRAFSKPSIKYLEVEPNPVKDNLTIVFDTNIAEDNMRIEVYQLNGQKVYEQAIEVGVGIQRTVIDLATIPNGIYMISLNINGALFTEKFVKED